MKNRITRISHTHPLRIKHLFLLSCLFLYQFPVFSQPNILVTSECKSGSQVESHPSTALLLINSREQLSFFSKRNNGFMTASETNGQYTLTLGLKPDIITIANKEGLNTKLNFTLNNTSQDDFPVKVPAAGETYCYSITSDFQIELTPLPGLENFIHPDGSGLIMLKHSPGLNLSFESKTGSTNNILRSADTTLSTGNHYMIYIKTGTEFIKIKADGYQDYTLRFPPASGYPVIAYSVRAPKTSDNFVITSDPAGALVQIKDDKTFNSEKHLTPCSFIKKCGTYQIILIHEKYDTIKALIQTCSDTISSKHFLLKAGYAKIIFNVEPGLNIAKVFSNEKPVTFRDNNMLEMRKGEVNLMLFAPKYKTETISFSLTHDTVITKKMERLQGRGIKLFTNPEKVNVTINNSWNFNATAPFFVKLDRGQYRVHLENKLYYPKDTTINVLPSVSTYSIPRLKPRLFRLILKIKGRAKEDYTIYLDNESLGETDYYHNFNKEVEAGYHMLKVHYDGRTVFKSRVKVDDKNRKEIIWIPSKVSWSAISIGYALPVSYFTDQFDHMFTDPVVFKEGSYSLGLSAFSFFGLTLLPVRVETSNTPAFPEKPYIFSLVNPEYRLGFNITNWLDFSLFVNASYKTNLLYEEKQNKQSTNYDIRGYQYGVAFNIFTHSRYRWAWVSLTLKAGVREDDIIYRVWNGTQKLPEQTAHEYNGFVSVYLNFLTVGDGMVQRVFKKPLWHAGAF